MNNMDDKYMRSLKRRMLLNDIMNVLIRVYFSIPLIGIVISFVGLVYPSMTGIGLSIVGIWIVTIGLVGIFYILFGSW